MMAGHNEIEKRRLSVLADELGQEVAAEDAARDAVSHAIGVGELLTEAKSLVKHGEWRPWLAANFPGSERTAQTWMAASRQRARWPARLHPGGVADDVAVGRAKRARPA